jgi:hypothetical protein
MLKERRPWVGFDLDGTTAIAYWDAEPFEPYDPVKIGAPIPKTIERIKNYIWEGYYEVRIFTARVGPNGSAAHTAALENIEDIRQAIRDWTKEHIGLALEATCTKDYDMKLLYDDRARQVQYNEGTVIGE